MTKQYANYADLITFTRASTGTALRRVGYSPELVTNGTFDTDTDWTKVGTTTISGGQATLASAFAYIDQPLAVSNRDVVRVSYEVVSNTDVGGNLALSNGGFTNATVFITDTVGTHTLDVVVNDATKPLRLIIAKASTVVLDNVSVKEVIFDRATDPLVLFNHPTNVPRIEYDANGNRKGLLIEEARTNFVPNSQGGTNVNSFSLGTGSFDLELEDYSVAPDGTTTGLQLKWFMGATGGSYAGVTISAGTLSSQIRTFSFFGKSNTASNQTMQFRKSDGSVVTNITITPEWQRFSISDSVASTGTNFQIWSPFSVSYTANVDISIWGAQLEAGSFPTSYISTAGAAASRSADAASIPTSAFGYNQKAGTVVVDFDLTYGATGLPRVWEIGNAVNTHDRILLFANAGANSLRNAFTSNNVDQANFALAASLTGTVSGKVASAFAENDFVGVLDGGAVVTDTSGTVTPSLPRETIKLGGSTTTTADTRQVWIKSIQYYPRRLTNAQLQELTS